MTSNTSMNWVGNTARIISPDRAVDLYWKDMNQQNFEGLTIVQFSPTEHYSVGLTVAEAAKLRDYLNSVIPK